MRRCGRRSDDETTFEGHGLSSAPNGRTRWGAADRYLDYSGRDDRLSGGARRIPVDTPAGPFAVWTKRVGNNPELKVLLLHGGPGCTHEYLEACDGYPSRRGDRVLLPGRRPAPHRRADTRH